MLSVTLRAKAIIRIKDWVLFLTRDSVTGSSNSDVDRAGLQQFLARATCCLRDPEMEIRDSRHTTFRKDSMFNFMILPNEAVMLSQPCPILSILDHRPKCCSLVRFEHPPENLATRVLRYLGDELNFLDPLVSDTPLLDVLHQLVA